MFGRFASGHYGACVVSQAVYFNQIFKNGKTQYVVKALSGQHIKGRDGQRHASRSFTELHQAEAFLARNGYKSSSR